MAGTRAIIGIDEVGRGPIAGPLLICALHLPVGYDQRKLAGVRDSKKFSKEEREEWFAFAKYERSQGNLSWAFGWVSPGRIDSGGMSRALRSAVARTLKQLQATTENVEIFLDGSLYAPKEFTQQTIIGGDDKIPAISLASNIAKVTRDKRMERLAQQFPEYGFEQHKGYGTKAHYVALKQHGPTEIHRKSFLTNI
jgi:ribonuclease HII